MGVRQDFLTETLKTRAKKTRAFFYNVWPMEPKIVDLLIEDFCARGFGLARIGKVDIEVANAIPGDTVRAELFRRCRRVRKGRLLELLQPSSERIPARCAHATMCGGCCWQSMDYSAQTARKQDYVLRFFHDIIHPAVEVLPLIPCPDPWRYRNKMEFSFSMNRAGTKYLGLMIAHAEPYVFNLEHCHIAPQWMSDCVLRMRQFWEPSDLRAYHPPKDEGSLRYLTLREAVATGQKMAILNVSGNPAFALSSQHIEQFVQAMGDGIGIFLRVHHQKKGVPTSFTEVHLKGNDHIVEKLRLAHGTLEFKISPSSFFQPNTLQAEKLYDAAMAMIGTDHPVVYDLYCGTGTLGMAAAAVARQVIGIELNSEAVRDAKENAKRNNLQNIEFYSGDAGSVMTQLMAQKNFLRPDVIIVDPPRAGLDDLTIHHLITIHPKKIIYVSCNPATQAENVRRLVQAGYRLEKLQAVDQFPHTAHIENIALLHG